MSHHISTQCGRNAVLGLPQKKSRPSPSLEMTSILNFPRRPPCGGMSSFAIARRARQAAQFSFSALTSFGLVYVFVSYSDMRQQVPKPMYVIAFEGEKLAYSANGDRYELKATLPRRKPRTDFFPALALLPVNQLYLPT